MKDDSTYSGLAALSICEALLLALKDNNLLPDHEIEGVLRDAAATHENAAVIANHPEAHMAVVSLINRILVGSNSARHP